MILAAFASMLAWATATPPGDGVGSPSHPGRGGPEAREGWGAAQPRDSLAAGLDERRVVTNDRGADGVLRSQGVSQGGSTLATVTYTQHPAYGVVDGWSLVRPGKPKL